MATSDRTPAGRRIRTDGLFLGLIILTVAISIIIWHETDASGWIVMFIPFITIGAYLVLMSFFVPKASAVGPSSSSYYMVWGVLLLTVGGLGIAKTGYGISWIVITGIFLAVLALLIIWRSISARD